MSLAALRRIGAEMEQAPEGEDAAETARQAELRAAFELFGARTTPLPDWPAPIWAEPHLAYRAAAAPDAAPANEHAPDASPAAEPSPQPSARPAIPAAPPRRGPRLDPRLGALALKGADWLIAALAAHCAALWGLNAPLGALTLGQAWVFVCAALMLKAGLWASSAYKIAPSKLRAEHALGGLTLGALAAMSFASLAAPDGRSAAALAVVLPLAAMAMAAAHAVIAVWLTAARRAGLFTETVVLVGATDAAARLVARAAASGEARVLAVFDDRAARAPAYVAGAPVVGGVDDLLAWDGLPEVDRIVITVTQKAEARVRALIKRLRIAPNRIDLLLDYQTESVRGKNIDRLTGAALACVSGACVSGRANMAAHGDAKRIQDIVLSAALLIVFAPVMALIALAVKLDSKGPALYRQRRHGFNNRIITIYKFRSMRHQPDAPAEACLAQVRAADPRITRIGAFLRRTSLDELPQLWNVLAGEMSLVGPRPHAVGMRAADLDLTQIVAEYAHRHRVKPGITGWAQINGSRGPIDTPEAVRRRVELDLDYIANASIWFDLWILLRTAPVLLGDRKATR